MFKNFHIEQELEYDSTYNLYYYIITIVDDNFSETIKISAYKSSRSIALVVGLIQIYFRKSLNISYNLYLLCRYRQLSSSKWTVSEQLDYYYDCIPSYRSYHQSVLLYHNRYNNQKVFW